ncbi:MAG TPA: hypothetical protein DIU15_07900 [Deltaproteobacteria bacterium]|nr:hypothetical protein [Deltaproteobacteria bacterium]
MITNFSVMKWYRLPVLALGLGFLAGCPAQDVESNSLRPTWYANQEFHLESRYKKIGMMTERGDASADPAADSLEDTMDLADSWSESVYWRYQVIRQGYLPEDSSDDFYEYAHMGGTESPITVIKASLDPTLNLDAELAEAEPKIYMVIREDRLRMAGLVYFYTVNGERLSQAVTVDPDEMNRSYSRLSQANLAPIPHFIPPFPIAPEDKDVVLEDGQLVSFSNATEASVDVIYENSYDATLISENWASGQPWATLSITPTVESRLMSTDEVASLTGPMGGAFDDHEDDEDYDFVARLKEGVNLTASLNINDMVGTSTHEVRSGYRPWAGSWWRQSEGALIFGYHASTNDTISEVHKAVFEESATKVQNLGDELRDLRKNGNEDSEEYTSKREEYGTTRDKLVEDLVAFYNAVYQAIDGGQITISDDKIAADENWNGNSEDPYPAFNFDINTMSPLDKFALLQQLNNNTHGSNPWFGPAWEILNHWSPAGSSWFGHCNGWSAAAILTKQPTEDVNVPFGSTNQFDLDLTAPDQKGLLSETYYSQLSHFFGERYNGDEGEDISDLSPKAVLQLLSSYIGERQVPIVFDTSANEEVWNYPAWSYTLVLNETTNGGTGAATGLININTAGPDELMTLWGISTVRAQRIIQHREQAGPFQSIEDLVDVRGIGLGILNRIREQITVSQDSDLRTLSGEVRVRFATDGVSYTHIDTNEDAPQGFWKTWKFSLEASPAGEIISGTWENPDSNHPDFAWVPYVNTVNTGRSENNYLHWTNLKGYLPGIVRE